MNTPARRYLAFMLRLWQAGGEGETSWRVSLESPHTGERRGFANLEALVAFLEEQTGAQIGRSSPPDVSSSELAHPEQGAAQ